MDMIGGKIDTVIIISEYIKYVMLVDEMKAPNDHPTSRDCALRSIAHIVKMTASRGTIWTTSHVNMCRWVIDNLTGGTRYNWYFHDKYTTCAPYKIIQHVLGSTDKNRLRKLVSKYSLNNIMTRIQQTDLIKIIRDAADKHTIRLNEIDLPANSIGIKHCVFRESFDDNMLLNGFVGWIRQRFYIVMDFARMKYMKDHYKKDYVRIRELDNKVVENTANESTSTETTDTVNMDTDTTANVNTTNDQK
jgi:hypothetical protein